MKTSLRILLIALFISCSTGLRAGSHTPEKTAITSDESVRMMKRLEELKAMDTRSMTKQQRHDRREEVKSIRKATSSGGVYISVAGLLLIAILLIILL